VTDRILKPAVAAAAVLLAACGAGLGGTAFAAPPPPVPLLPYADLADLADHAPMVVRARIRSIAVVEPARAPGLRPGHARLFVEARTTTLLSGPPLTGDSLRYLADVPLDAKGKPPKLVKREVLLFARTVPARPGELQLVAPDAQVLWSPANEERLRAILGELLAPGAPGRVTRVSEAIYVPGTLAGEGETQMFLDTADREPASITVTHRAGSEAHWNVSFSEVVNAEGTAPAPDTLAWYRLACFLPRHLDPAVNVSASAQDKAQAAADYAYVLGRLGECPRTRG